MFSFLYAALVVLITFVITTDTAPSLTLKTSTANVEVDGLYNLKVTVIVFNTGNETLKLLNDPRGVLSPFPDHSFTITNADGSRPSFNGAKASFNPTYAVDIDDPGDFTVLVPGASTNVTHDLSAAYNFTRSGAGDYSIEPSNLFTYVDADGRLKNLHAIVENVAEVKLSGILAVSRHVHDKRDLEPGDYECWGYQKLAISEAAFSADLYAKEAYDYLKPLRFTTIRYGDWFGPYTVPRKKIVEDHFLEMSNNPIRGFRFICTTRYPAFFAFVYPKEFGKIYIGGRFWRLRKTGPTSMAGVLIHETSHFEMIGATNDYAYAKKDCQTLATFYPDYAVMNADSHRFFVENDPYEP